MLGASCPLIEDLPSVHYAKEVPTQNLWQPKVKKPVSNVNEGSTVRLGPAHVLFALVAGTDKVMVFPNVLFVRQESTVGLSAKPRWIPAQNALSASTFLEVGLQFAVTVREVASSTALQPLNALYARGALTRLRVEQKCVHHAIRVSFPRNLVLPARKYVNYAPPGRIQKAMVL